MLKTLAKSIREFKKDAIAAPLYMVGEVSMETLIPLVMAKLIDALNTESLGTLLSYGGILVGLSVASLFFGVMSARKAAKASCGFATNLRHDIFHHVMDFSFADVDKFSTSSLVTRMTTDVSNVRNAFGMLMRMAIRVPLTFLFAIIMGFSIHPKLTCIFLAIIPPLSITLFFIIKTVHQTFKRIFKKYDALNNSVQENVASIRVVKSFVREDFEIKKFKEKSDDVYREFRGAERLMALFNPIMNFFIDLAMILLCFFGSRIIVNTGHNPVPELTTGNLSSLTTYGLSILSSLMMLGLFFVMITMAGAAGNRIAEVLNYEATLTSKEGGIKEVKDGSVKFNHVSFRYSEKAERNALEDIDLYIESGKTIGIIGGTGSSKTTFIQLISRLYDATEGSVEVGGINVKDYDLEALRDQVAVVLQKNILFSGTIKENMRWGNKEATDQEIEEACKAACAHEFIETFPDKYDTYIEKGGTNVSGGQKQRLCIARALLKKPKILILDDSTSAVDTRTDALIRNSFKKIIPGTTKIIIAQRVSSVEDADEILVLDGGKIVERGTSDELRALGGIYAEVYETQTKGKEA